MNLHDTAGAVLAHKGREIRSIAPAATVYEALELMARHDIGALLVIDNGRMAGIVSERDYARKIILHGKSSRETTVAEVMTRDPQFVRPEHTVEECMRIMTDYRIRHLPVLDAEEIAGVLSIGDLVNWIIGAQRAEIEQLQAYIAGSYPA